MTALQQRAKLAMAKRKERLAAAPRSGKLWTQDEKNELIVRFTNDSPLEEIARNHGRTKSAIVSQLGLMGLIVYFRDGYYKVDPKRWATWQEVNS